MSIPSCSLRFNLLLTDIGFLLYWAMTAFGVLPPSWLFKDYQNPILVSWNWSFAPVDLLASVLGLTALAAAKRRGHAWRQYALSSATLTFCAGFMALAFWAIQQDFDPWWWAPNLYLMAWPLFFIPDLLCNETAGTPPSDASVGQRQATHT